MDKEDVVPVYPGDIPQPYKGNGIDSFVVMWVDPEPVIQSEVSQEEKNK